MVANALVVDSEEKVWTLLEGFATNSLRTEDVQFAFDTFPRITVKFEGPNFHSTLPVRAMEGLKAIQEEIYRLYALAVYGDNTTLLSKEEKDSLELFFKIREGSSDGEPINLTEVLKTIVNAAKEKMEPKHWIIVVSIAAAAWATPNIVRTFVEANTNIEIEKMRNEQALAQAGAEGVRQKEETKRFEILADVVKKVPVARDVLESHDKTNEKLSKSIKGNEKVILPDKTEVTETIAKELYPKSKRRTPVDIQMNGEYRIHSIERNSDVLRVKILDSQGVQFSATAPLANQDLLDAISLAVARGEIIFLNINAKDLEGEKRDLIVVGHVPSSDDEAIASRNP